MEKLHTREPARPWEPVCLERRFIMRNRLKAPMIAIAAVAVLTVGWWSLAPTAGQAGRLARIDGHPNFSGVWQALNEANWDLEAHAARPGMMTQVGVHPLALVPAAP